RLAGEVLATRQPPPVVQLTRHFREAGEAARWCQYAELAAERAISGGDYTTAAVLLTDLLAENGGGLGARSRVAPRRATGGRPRREPVDQLHQRVADTLRQLLPRGGLSPAEAAPIRRPLGRLLAQQGDSSAAHAELEQAVPYLPED